MEAHERVEASVRRHCDAAQWQDAATLLLQTYGPELFGFLVVAHGRDEAEASEAFSELGEAIWRGLSSFAWSCTARTWAYGIAHKIVLKRRRDGARRRARAHPGGSALDEIAARVRTQTLSFLRTEKRTRLQALRDALAEDEKVLLLLRVDRGLSWSDIALVLADGEALDREALAREAARLRKRYQLLKDRMRELARREGLIE